MSVVHCMMNNLEKAEATVISVLLKKFPPFTPKKNFFNLKNSINIEYGNHWTLEKLLLLRWIAMRRCWKARATYFPKKKNEKKKKLGLHGIQYENDYVSSFDAPCKPLNHLIIITLLAKEVEI